MSSAYEIKLELFEGPLDLLLYLIKKQDMDIKDIRISEITQEYLSYIQIMKDLNLEMAGEFLVMASTLMQIKTRMLLPADSKNQDLEEGPDPRAELVTKLIEYQKFKEAAKFFSVREFESREVYYRNVLPVFSEEEMTLEATIFDLIDAFKDVLKHADHEVKELLYTEIPIEQKIREILDLFENKTCIRFIEVFSNNRSKRELIVTFLAVLELIRLKQIIAKQSEHFSEIWIYKILEPSVN